MPAEEGNMAFTMTTLPHLKALVAVEANRCSAVYDSNESDNEVIMDSTECYTIPSTNVTTHNQDGMYYFYNPSYMHCNHFLLIL